MRKPDSLGGHAFALVGFNRIGFVVQNSWGLPWGNCGFGVLPYEEWVKYGTDSWIAALGVPVDKRRRLRACRWPQGEDRDCARRRDHVHVELGEGAAAEGYARKSRRGAPRKHIGTRIVMGNDGAGDQSHPHA